jgi:hypothetical protein
MSLVPILAAWIRGCTCPAIEYSSGELMAIIQKDCPKHHKLFPPPALTEREKYERAFREK